MRTVLLVATLLVLSACGSTRPLPVATGPVRALNVGHWMPGPNELTVPPS